MIGQNFYNKYEIFEDLIYELLVKLGKYKVEKNVRYNGHKNHQREIDILMGEEDNLENPLTAVEIKFYRPFSKPSASVLQRAIQHVEQHIQTSNITNGLLIISCKLNSYDLRILEDPRIEIWDLYTLILKAEIYPDILGKICDLLELDKSLSISDLKRLVNDQSLEGEKLLNELKSIPAGKDGAYEFESWCIDVLKYLFGDYLTGWHEQSETIDGLNRRDLVCRVISQSQAEIWELIMDTLRSRYVVFEFKNYKEKISQREIITTERYLYPTALRNCAIVISREGSANSANRVIEGAMREHGKLIISLNYNDIRNMLEGKDNGDDPNVYLFDKVDEFLIGLGR